MGAMLCCQQDAAAAVLPLGQKVGTRSTYQVVEHLHSCDLALLVQLEHLRHLPHNGGTRHTQVVLSNNMWCSGHALLFLISDPAAHQEFGLVGQLHAANHQAFFTYSGDS